MSELKDTYKTINAPSKETLFKEKGSKFLGYAFPVVNEKDVHTLLTTIKQQHRSARHWCYAYQIGTEKKVFRANDDGEPSNSAGTPIYGQIQSFGLTNVLVIVVRYFGGVKLGVGGLVQAYKTTAQTTLKSCTIIEKTINVSYLILFEYKEMNKVMRVIKEKGLTITDQVLELTCAISISVRKSNAEQVYHKFNGLYGVEIKPL